MTDPEQDTDDDAITGRYRPYASRYELTPGRPWPVKSKSLAELALETGDPSALVLYVNPNSPVPYRLQVAYLWIKRALGFKL